MEKIIYYYKLSDDSLVKKLRVALQNLRSDEELSLEVKSACSRVIDKLYHNRYLILDGACHSSSYEDANDLFEIHNVSVWTNVPQFYQACRRDAYISDSFPVKVRSSYKRLLDVIKSIIILNSNSKTKEKDGKDQGQLQGEADSDSGCYEGSVLHCRRNRPQFAAGRHCDQARVEIQGTRVGGGKIYLSSRRPEILRSRLSDRQSQGVTQESSQAPGRARIPGYCSGINGRPDLVGQIRVLSSREECTQIGDAYRAKDGTAFVATKFDGQLGLVFTMI